jgi:hypothetical protein
MNIPEFKTIPRAIAIDLDGTLLNSQTQLSERNHRALEQCVAHCIPIIIATSRPARIFNRIFPEDLRQKCSFVLMNGAIAKGNPPLSGYYKETLSANIMKDIVDCAKSFDPHIRITIEIEGYEFGTNWQWDSTSLWQRNSATPDMVLSIEQAIKRQPCKIALGNTDIVPLTEILEYKFGGIVSIVGAKFTDALSNPILNVTSNNATKPEALRKLLSSQGIPLKDVLAFGDDLPDLDMLKACGMPVAMANAFPEVKAICKYQTAINEEDGVALVLEKMLSAML